MLLYEPINNCTSIEELRKREKLLTDKVLLELVKIMESEIERHKNLVMQRYNRRYSLKNIIRRNVREIIKNLTHWKK